MSMMDRVRRLIDRARGLGFDRCPGCSGPVPYESPGVTIFRHEDGHEEFGVFSPGDTEFCRFCWQSVDGQGRGEGYPVPRMGSRWTPPGEPETSPSMAFLIDVSGDDGPVIVGEPEPEEVS